MIMNLSSHFFLYFSEFTSKPTKTEVMRKRELSDGFLFRLKQNIKLAQIPFKKI